MPYCTGCGRYLFDGEICSCRNGGGNTDNYRAVPPQSTNSGAMQQGGYSPYGQRPYQYGYQQYPQQPYPNSYGGYYSPYGVPKKSSGAGVTALVISIIAIILITVAVVIGTLAVDIGKRVKQTKANSAAADIMNSAAAVLADIEGKNGNIKGMYIISSDKDDNVAVPFDIGNFNERVEYGFDGAGDYRYFIIVKNGEIIYAAASESWTDKKEVIGTFPESDDKPVLYSPYGFRINVREKQNLDDVYWDAYDKIFNK